MLPADLLHLVVCFVPWRDTRAALGYDMERCIRHNVPPLRLPPSSAALTTSFHYRTECWHGRGGTRYTQFEYSSSLFRLFFFVNFFVPERALSVSLRYYVSDFEMDVVTRQAMTQPTTRSAKLVTRNVDTGSYTRLSRRRTLVCDAYQSLNQRLRVHDERHPDFELVDLDYVVEHAYDIF